MDNQFIGCANVGGASADIDALRSSAHPMGSIFLSPIIRFIILLINRYFRQPRVASSPAGEGWGEENKIKALSYPLIQPSPSGEGF